MLEEAVESGVGVLLVLLELGGHKEADGRTAIDNGEVAVGGEDFEWRSRMAPVVGEETPLDFEAGCLAGDDFFAEGDRGGADGDDEESAGL